MTSLENFDGLHRYLRKGIHTVSGYLTSIDATAIAAIGEFQTAKGVRGGLCELGVHHGRLFFILANLRRAGEKSLAVDLFEDGEGNSDRVHRGRNTAMFRNVKRLGLEISDEEVLIANTLQVKPDEIIGRVGKPRIVSVDAGHLYDEVQSDLNLSAQVLADEGVIIADDYFNIYWPDVTTATNDFLAKQNGKFSAFLITPGKLYICRTDYLPLYQEFTRKLTASSDVKSRTVELNKCQLTGVRMSRRGTLRHKMNQLVSGRRLNYVT